MYNVTDQQCEGCALCTIINLHKLIASPYW